jgi:DNA-binding MarR family transcriptional regulator
MSKADSIPLAVTHLVRDSCLCLHAQRAARALARRFDEALAAVELSSGQFSLLTSLNRPKPPGVGEVAQTLSMDRTTLTANLKPLQRRGLVKVSVDPDDRRSRLLLLTPAGKRLLAKAVPIWRRTHGALDRNFSRKELATLRSGLAALGGD